MKTVVEEGVLKMCPYLRASPSPTLPLGDSGISCLSFPGRVLSQPWSLVGPTPHFSTSVLNEWRG